MRVGFVVAALAAVFWAQPAAAQTFPFTNYQGFDGSLVWTIVSDTPDTAYTVSWDANFNIDGRSCNPMYETCTVPDPWHYSYTFTAGLDPTRQTLTFDLPATFAGVYGTLEFSGGGRLLGLAVIQPDSDGRWVNFLYLPEPSTWAMMLLGFGAIGVALRRSRPNKTTAALVG